jgi:UDP-GlcNAc3NAcA epimerase
MKILTVVGARPQFIKAATVSRALAEQRDFSEVIVHTGQHYDPNMSAVFFDELEIPTPKYNLEIGGGSHGQMTGRQLESIESVLLYEKPDFVLVYGDTNSTFAGALAAAKLHIPVAHVEAGLRSFNKRMPEEINRVMTDHISEVLFAPTHTAMQNLNHEGLDDKAILVGDVMFDASLFYRDRATRPGCFPEALNSGSKFILATVHRAENTDDEASLAGIIEGLANSQLPVILPLHPRTKSRISEFNLTLPENIHIVPPVSYLEMIWFEANCEIVATDSGGVQKEAFFFEKPCVTLRNETEWVELVEEGWNVLAGTDAKFIAESIDGAKKNPGVTKRIYGEGDAAKKIVETLWSSKSLKP